MVQMQANQHLLLQPWILAERIGSIVLSGYILDTTPDVSWVTAGVTATLAVARHRGTHWHNTL